MPTKFCSELRDRAVRMVYDRHALESGPGAQSTRAVAPELGVGEEPLRSWCNRYGPAERSSRPQESLEEENRRLMSAATRNCPVTATKVPAGGHEFCPVAVTGSARM